MLMPCARGASVERPQSVVSNVSPNNVSSMNGSMSRPESRLYQQNTRTIGRPSSSLQSLNHPSNAKQNSETSFQHQNQSYREQNHLQQPHHHHQHLQPSGDELHGKVARKTTDVQLPVEQNRDLKRIVLRKSDQDGGGLGVQYQGWGGTFGGDLCVAGGTKQFGREKRVNQRRPDYAGQ